MMAVPACHLEINQPRAHESNHEQGCNKRYRTDDEHEFGDDDE